LCRSRPNAPQKKAQLFNHVVGEREQLVGNSSNFADRENLGTDANLSQLTQLVALPMLW
jgi:hypothetical protein